MDGDINTIIANVVFSRAEFNAVLEYDKARQHDNQKIIIDVEDTSLTAKCRILPIKLKNAVDSGDVKITELEITSTSSRLGLFHHRKLLKDINFGPKHLHITALDYSFDDEYDFTTFLCESARFITSFIKGYKDTIDQLTLHFGKVDMDFFKNIYKKLEKWAINTPLNISLTAGKDADNIPYENILEYNYMQEKLNFIANCRHYSKEYEKSLNTINDNTNIYEKIINNSPEFVKNFSEYDSSIVEKLMGNNMYNAFLREYINHSTIVKSLSEYCYNYTKQREDKRKLECLPDDVKELIVKHIGGIAAIAEIDSALENNNSTTDQQDDVINQAEAMNDVNLTTSGTTADSDCSDGSLQS